MTHVWLFWIAAVLLLGLLAHHLGEWLELRRIAALRARLAALGSRHPDVRLVVETIWVGWRVRHYYLFQPSAAPAGPRPVILAFHGGEGTGLRFSRQTHLNSIAEREGVVVVYPAARAYWNDGRRTTAREGDDVAFVRALIDRLVARGEADAERIYATGVSNGGIFVLRLACEAADHIAAFAPVLASMAADYAGRCRPGRPAPVLMVNSTSDRFVPWEGGDILLGRNLGRGGRVIAVEETVEFWRRRNGCWSARRVQRLPVPQWDQPPMPVDLMTYSGCRGTPVALVRIQGAGHAWPGSRVPPQPQIAQLVGRTSSLDASELIWDFFAPLRLSGGEGGQDDAPSDGAPVSPGPGGVDGGEALK